MAALEMLNIMATSRLRRCGQGVDKEGNIASMIQRAYDFFGPRRNLPIASPVSRIVNRGAESAAWVFHFHKRWNNRVEGALVRSQRIGMVRITILLESRVSPRSGGRTAEEGPRFENAEGLFRVDGTGTSCASQLENWYEFLPLPIRGPTVRRSRNR